MFLIFKKYYTYFIVVAIGLLIYFPSLKIGFSLIDDAYTVKLSRELINSLLHFDSKTVFSLLFESENGRVRPFYWIFQTIISSLSFYNVHIMHAFRLLQLVVALVLVKVTFTKLKLDNVFVPVAFLVYLLNFQNFENYYRIGPAETFQIILLGVILASILKLRRNNLKETIIISLISFISVFTKEQFFVSFLSFLFVYILLRYFSALNKGNNGYIQNNLLTYSVATFLFGCLMLLIRYRYPVFENAYANHYRFDTAAIVNNFTDLVSKLMHNNFPFLQITIVYFVYYWVKKVRNFKLDNIDVVYLLVFLLAVLQFGVLLPWDFPVERYLVVINYLLIYLYVITFTKLFSWLYKVFGRYFDTSPIARFVKLILILLLFSTFFVRNIFPIANFQIWQKTDTMMSNKMINSLNQLDRDSEVFVNYKTGEANIEIYLSTQWSLEQFYNRKDIKFIYLDEKNLCAEKDRYILDRTSDRKFESDAIEGNDLEVVGKGFEIYNPLTYGDVKRSFFTRSKTENWRVYRKYEWKIYRQISGNCLKI